MRSFFLTNILPIYQINQDCGQPIYHKHYLSNNTTLGQQISSANDINFQRGRARGGGGWGHGTLNNSLSVLVDMIYAICHELVKKCNHVITGTWARNKMQLPGAPVLMNVYKKKTNKINGINWKLTQNFLTAWSTLLGNGKTPAARRGLSSRTGDLIIPHTLLPPPPTPPPPPNPCQD